MARVATGKIGLGAAMVLVCLALTNLAGGEDCQQSNLPGNWGYPPDWCCAFVVTADQATVDPGATATFTIGPPCPGVTCTVGSNSGCGANKFTCSVPEDGSKASVVVGATACGSFKITVSIDCPAKGVVQAGSGYVRINNKGQGGSWQRAWGGAGNNIPCWTGTSCSPQTPVTHAIDYYHEFSPQCLLGTGDGGRYKLTSYGNPNSGWRHQCCINNLLYGCGDGFSPVPCHPEINCDGVGSPQYGAYFRYDAEVWEWNCPCP